MICVVICCLSYNYETMTNVYEMSFCCCNVVCPYLCHREINKANKITFSNNCQQQPPYEIS